MVMLKLAIERKPVLSTPTSKRTKLARCTSDRIILPDEILGYILSLLTIKEAVCTSVLSKRWMHLWKYFTRSLISDTSKKLYCGNVVVVKRERSKYVKWLNKVIDSLEGNSIDELCVWFDLDESFSSDIDRWVKFAISKRVQRLTVDLHRVMWNDEGPEYSFRAGLLEIPNRSFNMKFLTSLCFRYVDITGKLLEYFLCNCPLLEKLSVTCSGSVGRLVVPSSAVQLKCLEIFTCWLEHVDIKAPNLVTLKYFGFKEALHIGNLSKLVDLTLGGRHARDGLDKFRMFSSYLCQLEFLKLSTIAGVFQKCTLELLWDPRSGRKREMIPNAPALSHQCLKVVEILGFEGRKGQLNLAMYMIKSSIKLEKLIIDRRKPRACIPTPAWDFKETKKTQAAKVSAMQLEKKLPPGAKLFVK